MCTAISLNAYDHYFGRNLDLEYGYCEQVVVTPRNFPFHFRHLPCLTSHFAMIGMATVAEGYPLYYEATNECGLSIAGLNFPHLAHYQTYCEGKINVATFELIPYLLGQCRNVDEAVSRLSGIRIVDTPFSREYSPTPLHWMLCDKDRCVTVESTKNGLMIYHNPIGVMTNGPQWPYHLDRLKDYQGLSPFPVENRFAPELELAPYSGAMGAIGLPGDWSSASRFVRAAFVKLNSPVLTTDAENINQFFRILQSVSMPMGSIQVNPGLYDITRYSCCCNTHTLCYYYTTYAGSRIRCVAMHHHDLSLNHLSCYDLIDCPDIYMQSQP